MNTENYKILRKIIEEKCLEADDLIDFMDDKAVEEAIEWFNSHCTCGEPLKEYQIESGYCEDCC